MSASPHECPCCGAKAEVNWGRNHKECWAYVVCHNCGLHTRNHHGKTDKETAANAIETWNRRQEQMALFTFEG